MMLIKNVALTLFALVAAPALADNTPSLRNRELEEDKCGKLEKCKLEKFEKEDGKGDWYDCYVYKCRTSDKIDKMWFWDWDGKKYKLDYKDDWWFIGDDDGHPKCLKDCPEIEKVKGVYYDWDKNEHDCFEEKVEPECKKDKGIGGFLDDILSFCFSEANTVDVQGKGLISMDALQIGDYVRAGKDLYSRVYSFIHLDRDVKTDFLQIHAEGLNKPLEVTPEHMVFVDSTPVRASGIKVGDFLGENKVSQIKTVKRRGVYAPVTESGDLVVNGVLASSYAAVRPYSLINEHAEAHALFSLRRMVCAFDFGICKGETYSDDGIPEWLSPMANFAKSTQNNAPVQVATSLVSLPILAAATTLESVINYPMILCAIILGAYAVKATKTSKVKSVK